MALIGDVKSVMLSHYRATRSNWQAVFSAHGWNFTENQLASMSQAALEDNLLNFDLAIDRSRQGFEDFAAGATHMISPGQPGKSLLYHALASPLVHPTNDGSPSTNGNAYPSLDDLDTVENYIYSRVADRDDLDDTFVAVFAYQYRVGSRSPHRRHSDLAFSRTGVARVGTKPANYSTFRRSFWVEPRRGNEGLAVMPARYAAFLARRARPVGVGSVQGGHDGLVDERFVFPVHKLFDGRECLQGRNIAVEFAEYHRNEKLKRVHDLAGNGGIEAVPGFDTGGLPFVRDSENAGKLVALSPAGSSVLVVPVHNKELVRTVSQRNSVAGKNQIVHFRVPATTSFRGRSTRFATSTLEIPSFGDFRLAPEYVNIRHEVNPIGAATQVPSDLNDLPSPAFENKIAGGGYFAAHYTDDSCDGCVTASVSGLAGAVDDLPAYSLVTAPDFFPLSDQIELLESSAEIRRVRPLSLGRNPANTTLKRPGATSRRAFPRRDTTVTAIVGNLAAGPQLSAVGQANVQTSFLPDSASDVFAPGWDVSMVSDNVGVNLGSYGLGSPFPEDAKLCAALSSFWPAVAPDASRTFGNQGNFSNQLPMLDNELGFHPNHPRVASGEVAAHRGWDGEFGPFFEMIGNRRHVNFANIARSDYVTHAVEGRMTVSLTAGVQSEDLIERTIVLQLCQQVFATVGSVQADCLVEARRIDDWAGDNPGDSRLAGPGLEYVFADLGSEADNSDDLTRRRFRALATYRCQFASGGIAFRRNQAAFQFFAIG